MGELNSSTLPRCSMHHCSLTLRVIQSENTNSCSIDFSVDNYDPSATLHETLWYIVTDNMTCHVIMGVSFV